MPRRIRLELEYNLAEIVADNARIAGCRRSRQICTGREVVGVRAVIDLRCIGERTVRLAHLKARGIDATARDRSIAVLLCIELVVRAERVRQTRVLHAAAACIAVLVECRSRLVVTVAAGHPRYI